jgi:holo-[acyl-carrier protein] synthase
MNKACPGTGIGTDIMQISRMGRALARRPGLRERLFTPEERRYCEARANAAQHYAARFAAKEAVAKALGQSLSWQEVEILRNSGAPRPLLHGQAKLIAAAGRLEISLSHSGDYAIACALFSRG